MAEEIERKFLVAELPDLSGLEGVAIMQGYLRADRQGSVRLRITSAGAWLTVKGATRGNRRAEFEYPVPVEDARQMLDLLSVGEPVEKVRYRIEHRGHVWELDIFSGSNDGLVLVEVELPTVDLQPPLPDWVGAEVTDDPRYLNASLALEPYRRWAEPG